jgi:hypothetical protein
MFLLDKAPSIDAAPSVSFWMCLKQINYLGFQGGCQVWKDLGVPRFFPLTYGMKFGISKGHL